MAIIVDPDNLSQGFSKSVSDCVFSGASGATVTITSAGNNLSLVSTADYFEIRDHLVAGNNGLYLSSGTPTTGSITCTKQAGVNPVNASSEAVIMLGANTSASTEKSVFFDVDLKQIWLLDQGNLSVDGVVLQTLYSFAKEEWKADNFLNPYIFPFTAITPEQFEIVGDWEFANDLSRKRIRTGGWREIDELNVLKREYAGVITLGSFEDSASDLAYYQVGNDPTDTAAATNFEFAGPVNEAILTYNLNVGPFTTPNGLAFTASTIVRASGSWVTDGYREGAQVTVIGAENSLNNLTAVISVVTALTITVVGTPFTVASDDNTARVATNYRNAVKVFLRVRDGDTNGKTYAQADLPDIGVDAVDNKVFRFPLSNGTDLKISATDGTITGTSPYTQIDIRYFDQSFSRDIDLIGTPRNFGIVIDVGTFSGVDGSTVAAGSTLTTSEGGVPVTIYNGGTLTIHEGADKGVYTITTATGTTVGISGTFPTGASGSSFTLQRVSPVAATAEQIYEKVQYLLRQAADVDSTDQTVTGRTADELLEFVGDTLKAGLSIPVNPNGGGSGVIIEGFSANDTNRLVYFDNTASERTYPFVAAGTINWNTNLQTDADGFYWMYYRYTERFTNTGFSLASASGSTATLTSTVTDLTTELANGDFINTVGFLNENNNGIFVLTGAPAGTGPWTATVRKVDMETLTTEAAGPSVSVDKNPVGSPDAIIVLDNSSNPIQGTTFGSASDTFDFDYDGNSQGARTPGTDATVLIKAIGFSSAQYVEATGTIQRAVGLSFTLVSPLERNYSNI